jgi:hypothetical protein
MEKVFMPTTNKLREDAEAKFKKKELQRLDGRAAMAEYQAASLATAEKTARLRALRLSRDATPSPNSARSDGKRAAKSKPAGAASTA